MSEPIIREDGSKFLTLDIPSREGKEGYIGTIFSLFLRMGSIMSEPNFQPTDMRIEYMLHFMIALVPGKKNRLKMRNELNELLEIRLREARLKNGGEELNNEQRGRITNLVCLESLGDVTDFADKHVGVSSENKIGFVVK